MRRGTRAARSRRAQTKRARALRAKARRTRAARRNKLEQLSSDVTQDKTLQRTNEVECGKCGHNEAVLFQAESGLRAVSLSLIFVCTAEGCGNKWVG